MTKTVTKDRDSIADSAQALTDAEASALLQHLERSNTRTRTYIRNYLQTLFMLDTGIRVGELCGLQRFDLHLNGVAVQALRLRGCITKTGQERVIPLSWRCRETLKVYIAELPPACLCTLGPAWPTPRTPDKGISKRMVQYMLRDAGLVAIGRPIHPHMLRHTFATRALRVADIRTVQELMGHESIRSTQIYTHPTLDDMAGAIERMTGTPSRCLPNHPDALNGQRHYHFMDRQFDSMEAQP